MKPLLLTITLLILTFALATCSVAAETKRICHDKEVKGKMTKVCKDVKVHKKLEGTKVPEKKK